MVNFAYFSKLLYKPGAMTENDKEIVIITFYHFVDLPDYEQRRQPLLDFCNEHDLKGTILLAKEGVNSTISGTRENIAALINHLKSDPKFADLRWKESFADFKPFERMKVRLKVEIVRMGMEDMDISDRGEYVTSEEWDELISDPEVVTVDTRNIYETKIGTFEGAIDPETRNFREFPGWVEKNLDPEKHKKVAMYCTGGIRCEKSTALLKNMGFEDVYHLEGGILKYLEDTKNKNNKWQGECFVFDDRVAVNEELEPSGAVLCKRCGAPMGTDDLRAAPLDTIICQLCLSEK